MKLWAGRFSQELDAKVDAFNASISFDQRLYEQDIKGSMAHATMLGQQGIITHGEQEQILGGLEEILLALRNGALQIEPTAEDIHMFVEAELTRRIGEAGKKLHTGRSRNDQVATDTKCYAMAETAKLHNLVGELVEVLCHLGETHAHTIMSGYTHLQRAQPTTLGHHLMAYGQMFLRDQERLSDCLRRMRKECPLGSGAFAGTTHPIDRFATAEALGFEAPSVNSMDGVADRDYAIELLGCCALIMMHLSRFSEELILWCSWEFQYVKFEDAFSTGSSIMPQKKNPDIPELIRGKTGRVYGDFMALLTLMKGLPMAYNKDMQEDKESLFDGIDTTQICLELFTSLLEHLTFLPENMEKAAAKGFINATDCADYLVGKGMAFRDAYKITGEIVAQCLEEGVTLETFPLSSYQTHSPLFDKDIYTAVDLQTCVEKRTSYGGPAHVLEQVERTRNRILPKEEKA